MKTLILARRYAIAFLYKPEKSRYESLFADCRKLNRVFDHSDEMIKILKSRLTPIALKEEIFDTLIEQTENRSLWKGLFDTVLHNKREALVKDIIFEVESIILSRLNKLKLVLCFAREHKPETIEKIKARFKKEMSKEIFVEITIDPQIIGGFVGIIGNTRIDGSVRNALEKFQRTKVEY